MKLAIHHFETLSSTNDLCIHYANEGADEGTIIIADTQTKGKGRQGRIWEAPIGNLYTSLFITPQLHENPPLVKMYGQLALITGLSIIKALETLNVKNIQLKWPNDGIVGTKKIFGVLIECVDDDVVVGIGVNVNNAPSLSDRETTSLKELFGKEYDITEVFHAVLKSFWQTYRQWLTEGFASLQKECSKHLLGLEKTITINNLTGVFKGITDTGALLLMTPDDITHTISSS
ncbi:MAG: biotin--[acetyl-CoA-carboxylase] ligase [Candidatus Paracaedibacteraceae bacterium]|nr:biotin--[acetyl-CoA-carboxylase] ligase [Candidatus Paracaedibacteraceae bacterium]